MRLAVFRAMLLSLWRDPAAMAMNFLLPAAVFLIFAVIFAGASGGSLAIRLAVLDQENSRASKRFVKALSQHGQITRVGLSATEPAGVMALVRDGTADVGLIVREGGRSLGATSAAGAPPLLMIKDPTREIAVAVVEGIVQETYFRELPDVVVGGVAEIIGSRLIELQPAQKARLAAGLRAMSDSGAGKTETIALPFTNLLERRSGVGAASVPTSVSYYAGAVAMMFLLYSALIGAMGLLHEKESGLLERLSTGPSGPRAAIDGRFAFQVCQGFLQVAAIFVVAWVGFGLDLPQNLAAWTVTTLCATVCAAGLLVAFTAACRTVQQAQTLGTILVLVVSAIGGSMVPRFLMPATIQTIGWATPNAWALEAYGSIFWRAEGWTALLLPWLALGGSGIVGLLAAHVLLARAH